MHRSRLALSLSAGTAFLCAGLIAALYLVPAAPGKPTRHAAAVPTVVVTAGKPSEFAFTLSKRTIPAGTVKFMVTNKGKVPHTFEVCTGVTTSSKANTCAGKVTGTLKPGRSQTITVVALKKGKHEYLCTVPGHAQLGMKGLIGVGVAAPPAPKVTTVVSTTTATTTTTTTATTTTKTTCANPQTTNITANMFDFGFSGVPASAPCGVLNVTEVNTGQADHNIDFNGQAGGIISPGQSQTFKVNLTPGSYSYICDVPGHDGLGMHGQITITG
jgi:nitrite reductase (NO-forming)